MVIGVTFAEMVIAFRVPVTLLETGKRSPSLEGIHDVWRLVVLVGLAAFLISWIRGHSCGHVKETY
jgi:hypothetical protein